MRSCGLLMYGLAHTAIFLIADFEGSRVCGEEDSKRGGTREYLPIFEEANVFYLELTGAGGTFPCPIYFYLARRCIFPYPKEVEKAMDTRSAVAFVMGLDNVP